MNKFLVLVSLSLLSYYASAQTDKRDIDFFVKKFEQSFDPQYFFDHYKSLFTASFLVVNVNNKNVVDSIYFTDTAPAWQVEELEKIKKNRLNISVLNSYASRNKFTGKIVFPTIVKSIVTKGAIGDMDISSIYNSIARTKGNLLSGNIRFEKTIVVVAPASIVEKGGVKNAAAAQEK